MILCSIVENVIYCEFMQCTKYVLTSYKIGGYFGREDIQLNYRHFYVDEASTPQQLLVKFIEWPRLPPYATLKLRDCVSQLSDCKFGNNLLLLHQADRNVHCDTDTLLVGLCPQLQETTNL